MGIVLDARIRVTTDRNSNPRAGSLTGRVLESRVRVILLGSPIRRVRVPMVEYFGVLCVMIPTPGLGFL